MRKKMRASSGLVFCAALLAGGFARGDGVSEAQWFQLKELRGIFSGGSGLATTTYIFFDPNCPHSARLSKSGLGVPGVDLRRAMWIPVAYIRPSSSGRSAALLRAGNYQSIIQNYRHFNYAKYEGSIAPATPTLDELSALKHATAVWTSMTPTPGTPMVVYKDKAGSIKVQLGLPGKVPDRHREGMGVYGQ